MAVATTAGGEAFTDLGVLGVTPGAGFPVPPENGLRDIAVAEASEAAGVASQRPMEFPAET